MSAYPWTAWLWWSGGAMLGLSGLWLLYWSLLKDRAKGRRRCPKCWYDMSATKGLRCSECGYEAKREKKLYKTKRTWRCVFIAIILLIAGHITHTVPRIQKAGWIGTIPTTVLITVFPWRHKMRWNNTLAYQPGWSEAITSELIRRVDANETWQWQNHKFALMAVDLIMNNQQNIDGQSSSAIYYLYKLISEDASIVYPQLFKLLESEDTEIVILAGFLLVKHQTGDPIVLNKIEALMQHKDEAVRESAQYFLVRCTKKNPDYAIPFLIAAMHDPSPNVCASAINAVLYIKPAHSELIPTIEEFLDHEDEQVRAQAGFVLDYLKAAKNKSASKTPASSK